ncbi:acyl-CoA thioesterase [Luteimonas aquatica]|uniref:acyl-CoA thioesterase n=1 Tax=Luteimonas aquatica TaxID=450364 RepID=UPI001F59254F|nr:thioesterase family protein [Luteimonas aquatica]
MRFSELMRGMRRQGELWRAEVSEDWQQGRSLFGGLQAALAARAMRDLLPPGLPLRSLQTAFLAPVPAGPVELRAQVLRTGKNVQQLEARIVSGEQTLCLAIGVYGAARASQVEVMPRQPPVAEGAQIALPHLPGITPPDMPRSMPAPFGLPYVPGLMPSFTQHFAARWLQGSLPLSGSAETRQVLELDLLDEDGAMLDETHVLALADYIPPIALNMLAAPVAGSSLTWMIELLRDRYDDLGASGWRVDAELIAAREGYTNQGLTLWGPGGVPVALSRQTMVVFG